MRETTTLTVRLPVETQAQLAKLASHTNREQDILGAEAITAYVARELRIVAAIERGRVEARSGQGLATSDVFHDVEAAIAEVEAERGRR